MGLVSNITVYRNRGLLYSPPLLCYVTPKQVLYNSYVSIELRKFNANFESNP